MELASSKKKIDSNERANYAEHANQAHLRESSAEDESDDQSAAVKRGALGYGKSSSEEPRTAQEEEAIKNSDKEISIQVQLLVILSSSNHLCNEINLLLHLLYMELDSLIAYDLLAKGLAEIQQSHVIVLMMEKVLSY